jgi:hypothetical protein
VLKLLCLFISRWICFILKKVINWILFAVVGLDGTNIIFDGRFVKIGLPDIRAVPVRYVKFSIDVMVDERNIA